MNEVSVSFDNGFDSGRQAALDTINERIKYLTISSNNQVIKKIKLEINASIIELQFVRNVIEHLKPREKK